MKFGLRCKVLFSATIALSTINGFGSLRLAAIDLAPAGDHYPMVSPEGLQFWIEFPSAIDPGQLAYFGQGLYWQDGSSGTHDFTGKNSDAFFHFSYVVSNGFDNQLGLLTMAPPYGGGGDLGLESFWGLGTPDLIGNQINFIRLVVHDLNIEPYDPNQPFGQGLQWEGHITWEFWGTPIPEPAGLSFLAAALFFVRKKR